MPGIVVAGGSKGCGKTTLITGLALALKDSGFRVQAYKPLELETALGSRPAGQDQQFFNTITRQYIQAETLTFPSAWEVTPIAWNMVLERTRNLEYPCILEAPGQVATPWQIRGERFRMVWDVAQELALPVVVVAPAGPGFFEEIYTALSLIHLNGIPVAGFIRTQTQPAGDPPDPSDAMLLTRHFAVTFLGDLPYSPSISVPGMQQGNLTRLTQENIDLLPIQMAMGLTL